jgi:hypothetical protein
LDIRPGTIAQVAQLRSGQLVTIENDVCGFASQLKRIDPSLRLRLSEETGLFVVYQQLGVKEHLVTTAQELDGRLVAHVARIVHEHKHGRYDLAAELDKADREADRAADHAFSEEHGPIAERLHHAIRKDMDWSGDKVFIGKDVPDG